MWKTIFKTVLCVVLLGYVALAFAFVHQENARRLCPGIDLRIVGNTIPDSVLRQGVNSQLARYGKKLKGQPLGSIDLKQLEDYLSAFSNFESVECSFNPDSRLRITVIPIKAEVRVFSDKGKSFYINRYGKRIDADAEFYIDVPVLIAPEKYESSIPAALSLIRYAGADPELSPLIAAFKIDGPNDLIIIPRLQGHVINFGDSTRFDEKKAAILTAYRNVMPTKGWNTYDTISVKFKNQIVASRRNKTIATHGALEDDGEDLEEATLPDVANINTQNSAEENG
ncbi:MAG: hypothetical protein K2H38_04465 [Muribaculaceae bacterium]|nr:hypothetical protein [Muribaculaceae bacterium]MDE6551430.1 hypothetical protein [Muribaculaceae bacterium]